MAVSLAAVLRSLVTLDETATVDAALAVLATDGAARQRLFPVTDLEGNLSGVVTQNALTAAAARGRGKDHRGPRPARGDARGARAARAAVAPPRCARRSSGHGAVVTAGSAL